MSVGFSGVLRLTNLDDFITPSQECTKPAIQEERIPKKKGFIGIDGTVSEPPPKSEQGSGITIADCLACSGCITSAEAVLVSQQSLDQFLSVLKANNDPCMCTDKLTIVMSMAPQSVVSLAARYSLSPQECSQKLVGYLKKLGVDHIFDTSLASCLSLIESQSEFVQRYQRKDTEPSALPMLASACPGWICYAEKAHGSYILPHISTTRSPQQVMGALVKSYFADKEGIPPDKIYHVTLMPCFDKKLEASRDEFVLGLTDTKEVDSVITSVEIEELLTRDNIDLRTIDSQNFDQHLSISPELLGGPMIESWDGGVAPGIGSGGFAHYVFTESARQLFGEEPKLSWKSLRNNDFQEVYLEVNGEVKLRFAFAYGFRNIQNLVQKIKRQKSPYHYVEVMACPSGCLNGGAQIRPVDGATPGKQLVAELEQLYAALPQVNPKSDSRVESLYLEWLGGANSEKSKQLLHTTYKAIEANVSALGIKW